MNTTDLFVELVIIGVGVITWIIFLLLAVFGCEGIDSLNDTMALAGAIPFLALIYVFGIVFDRLADTLFGRYWGHVLRNRFFESDLAYFEARQTIYLHAEHSGRQLEYGRSRLRICRSSAINFVLIALTSFPFGWACVPLAFVVKFVVVSVLFWGLSAIATWLVWYKLTVSEYKKVKEQAEYLSRK